ncbi:MAG: hypothetical protein D6826_01700 [Alphaproteobacteria bacterium]|nr:MAG: hypothetical protein D6826_01700 [Alphaproteobacteria bacterium]
MQVCLILAAAWILAATTSARAETNAERLQRLEDQLRRSQETVQTLSSELQELKRRLEKSAEKQSEQSERLDELEDVATSMEERIGSRAVVKAFDAAELNLGGFLDMAATHVEGEDDGATNFNRIVFELLAGATLWEDWELFVAQAFLRKSGIDFSDRTNPDFADLGSVATDTVIAWGNYHYSDLLNVRAGRFITPHGIINIEHFPFVLLDPEQPQFLRPFSGQTIFPNFTDGLQVHGQTFMANGDALSYSVYGGNFAGNSTDFNFGGRVAYALGDIGLTLGLNSTYGKRADSFSDSDYVVYGGDILYDKGPILWKTEIFATSENRGSDRFAFYTQPAWRISDMWTLYYRFDYLDAGDDPITLSEIGQSTEHVGGVVFDVNSNVRLRAKYTFKQFEDTATQPEADAHILQLSATFNF